MPVWPKSFHAFGTNLRTAATEWKLRKKRTAPAAQERALAALTPRLAAASFWKQSGIEASMPYAKFRSRVPLRGVDQLAPAIARMIRGEGDLLWPGRCTLFAHTAGTTSGEARLLPVTDEFLAHVRRAGLDALLHYAVRVRHAGVFRGRQLLLGGTTALTPIAEAEPAKAFAGPLSGIAALSLPAWAEKHLYEPGTSVAQIDDWAARLDAIAARCGPRDISLIAALPEWAVLLADALREKLSQGKRRVTHLQAHWTNLECFVHSGAPIAPFAEELRGSLGPAVVFHEVYAATEGIFAVQDSEASKGLRVLADAGVFFEFVPMTDFDEARLEHIGGRAVPLADVKTGVEYAIVVTTPGGLARHVLGDVVRFTSTEPPRLIYVGRTRLRLHAFGENVAEREITEALGVVCQRRGWRIVNFEVAPLLSAVAPGRSARGRHEWWVELKPGTVATPTGKQMAADLDAEMQRISASYRTLREAGVLEAASARLVMPGVFEHWLRFRRQWGGQHKMPRCQSDRTVADELASVTNFASD